MNQPVKDTPVRVRSHPFGFIADAFRNGKHYIAVWFTKEKPSNESNASSMANIAKPKNAGGRPPKFTDAEAFRDRLTTYFESCETARQMPNEAGLCIWLHISRVFGMPVEGTGSQTGEPRDEEGAVIRARKRRTPPNGGVQKHRRECLY